MFYIVSSGGQYTGGSLVHYKEHTGGVKRILGGGPATKKQLGGPPPLYKGRELYEVNYVPATEEN